jgi:predicted CopG family antitoxin
VANIVSIDKLDETATKKAIQDFIDFYLRWLKKNDLEILAEYKVDYYLADINHFVFENQAFTPEQMRADLYKDRGQDIKHVISVINPDYDAEGHLMAGSWDQWYEDKFKQISVRD